MNATLVLGPSVTGTVTLELKNVTSEKAVRFVLATQAEKFEHRVLTSPRMTLVVAAPEHIAELCLDSENYLRMEYLLEEASATKVVDFLRGEYDRVRFAPHPTMNGFFAWGSKADLLQIKREMANLDRVPPPPRPPMRAYLPVKYADISEVRGLLGVMVPGAAYNVDKRQNLLVVEGSPGAIDQVRELLAELGPESESYTKVAETPYREVAERPLSTFAIDVDTAAYANMRRFLNDGLLPPEGSIRIEELINYFDFDYPQPEADVPFSVTTELSECPWKSGSQLLRIGLQGRRTDSQNTPPRNLVFLLDVSGSMDETHKLPLVKSSMQLLLSTLGENDRVAIVTYADGVALHLPGTACNEKRMISETVDRLTASGSTNGSGGIQMAYKVARENFQEGAINRVILCTDGDFNVGLTGGALINLIEKEREGGIFLSVLGFGTGNLKDDTLEELADQGNGNYAYIDSLSEAQKVLVREAGSTFETIAKDVKVQIEFNPKKVHSYRLVGYENRQLQDEDFANDEKDAGELGSGHNVTAIYELVPQGLPSNSALRYQTQRGTTARADSNELALLKLRYKEPTGDISKELQVPITNRLVSFEKSSEDMRFAISVAAFGLLIRDSEFRGNTNFSQVAKWAGSASNHDSSGYRQEFVRLVELAGSLKQQLRHQASR